MPGDIEIIIGLHAYKRAVELFEADEPFYALVAAAMIKADSTNLPRLQAAFPEVWAELDARWNSPAAVLPGTGEKDEDGRTAEDIAEIRQSMGLNPREETA